MYSFRLRKQQRSLPAGGAWRRELKLSRPHRIHQPLMVGTAPSPHKHIMRKQTAVLKHTSTKMISSNKISSDEFHFKLKYFFCFITFRLSRTIEKF